MNKQERIIAILLGLALVGWMFYSNKQAAGREREAALKTPPPAGETADPAGTLPAKPTALTAAPETPQPEAAHPAPPAQPEETVTLNGGDVTLAVSSHGAVIKRVTLNRFLS